MTKLKICGLFRPEDCDFVNDFPPDYVGFILGVEKSHRNVSFETFCTLHEKLAPEIGKVGVFVNEILENIEKYVKYLDVIQLHGQETEEDIAELRERFASVKIWKAFRVENLDDLKKAEESTADLVLLDGAGGAGKTFDWDLISNFSKDFALAGGISISNISQGIARLSPVLVDLSSGVETEKKKDREKIRQIYEEMRK